MCGSCHLDRASNDESSVECLFWFFHLTWKSDLKVIQITKNYLFWVMHPYNTLNLPKNCKTWPQLKKKNFRSDFCVGWKNSNKHSTLNLSFNALSKWNEPDISNTTLIEREKNFNRLTDIHFTVVSQCVDITIKLTMNTNWQILNLYQKQCEM